MSNEKIAAIADKLLEKSAKGEVAWSDTADARTFSVVFPDYSISVRSDYDYYEMSVHDERGNVVESLSGIMNEENYSKLRTLFESARRSALKSDEVLDNILERLSDD